MLLPKLLPKAMKIRIGNYSLYESCSNKHTYTSRINFQHKPEYNSTRYFVCESFSALFPTINSIPAYDALTGRGCIYILYIYCCCVSKEAVKLIGVWATSMNPSWSVCFNTTVLMNFKARGLVETRAYSGTDSSSSRRHVSTYVRHFLRLGPGAFMFCFRTWLRQFCFLSVPGIRYSGCTRYIWYQVRWLYQVPGTLEGVPI